MKILHLQTGGGTSGGIANYISELIRSEAFRPLNHFVCIGKTEYDEEKFRELYCNSIPIVCPTDYSLIAFFSYVYKLFRIVLSTNVDLIHAHAIRSAFPAAIVSLTIGVPLIYTNHGLRYTQKKRPFERWIFLWLEKITCWAACFSCSVRRHDYEIALSKKLTSEPKHRLITTRINFSQSFQTSSFSRVNLKKPLIVGLGSLIDVKRPDRFVQWIIELKKITSEFRLMWIGGGPLMPALEDACAAINVPIEITGMIPRKDVSKLLGQARLLFLTSDFEVLPLAVLESYAHGVPVLTTEFDGVGDFVIDGVTGHIIRHNLPAVMSYVSVLINDSSVWNTFSLASRRMFEAKFANPEFMATEYVALYQSCTKHCIS
jgi:glycosyltransferase involved in cell wall biosynthesis